jgi:hypothetical protein
MRSPAELPRRARKESIRVRREGIGRIQRPRPRSDLRKPVDRRKQQ